MQWVYAIDAGGSTMRGAAAGRPDAFRESSLVAARGGQNAPIAWGDKALGIYGREPEDVRILRAVKDGVPADIDLLARWIKRLYGEADRKTVRKTGVLLALSPAARPDVRDALERRVIEEGVPGVGLVRSDLACAIGAGADVALDTADVVLMKSRLSDVPAAIRLSRATLRNIHQNLFWAFFYNTLGIPLAAGVFVPLGLTLNPMFGAAAMSLSSFCVVSNALRLNLFKLHDAGKDKKINRHSKHKEETTMVKTMKIEGMMCGHCEAAVKKALEAIDGVASAEVSHTDGTAVVTLSKPVENAALRKAVEDKDYTVTDIEG